MNVNENSDKFGMGRGDQIRRTSKKSLKAMEDGLIQFDWQTRLYDLPSNPDPATDPEQSMQDGLLRSKLSGELIVPCMVMDSYAKDEKKLRPAVGSQPAMDKTRRPSKTVYGHQDGHQEPRDVIHPWSWNMPANDPRSAPCGGNGSDWADDGQGSHNGHLARLWLTFQRRRRDGHDKRLRHMTPTTLLYSIRWDLDVTVPLLVPSSVPRPLASSMASTGDHMRIITTWNIVFVALHVFFVSFLGKFLSCGAGSWPVSRGSLREDNLDCCQSIDVNWSWSSLTLSMQLQLSSPIALMASLGVQPCLIASTLSASFHQLQTMNFCPCGLRRTRLGSQVVGHSMARVIRKRQRIPNPPKWFYRLPAARPGQVLPGRALIGPGFFFSPSSSDHQLNTLKLTPVPTSWIRSRVKGAKPCPISGYLGQTRHRLQGPPRPLLLARLLLNRTEPVRRRGSKEGEKGTGADIQAKNMAAAVYATENELRPLHIPAVPLEMGQDLHLLDSVTGRFYRPRGDDIIILRTHRSSPEFDSLFIFGVRRSDGGSFGFWDAAGCLPNEMRGRADETHARSRLHHFHKFYEIGHLPNTIHRVLKRFSSNIKENVEVYNPKEKSSFIIGNTQLGDDSHRHELDGCSLTAAVLRRASKELGLLSRPQSAAMEFHFQMPRHPSFAPGAQSDTALAAATPPLDKSRCSGRKPIFLAVTAASLIGSIVGASSWSRTRLL
ncbi:uncharacterized protein CLUP02_11819 [Colletotrichum lupini]|uniref:Uncharacterized protein n=1 Tax=Colletotrichum lupini TaxID=145971 RepID=A0A9Q8WK45_9PEZI|nr:uncharacterized protein CLUP02_11819 [Colletotrichum lupini]UQC86319.1 hypothetical protein CLUP02_11819 [Colletotrichum lupini]